MKYLYLLTLLTLSGCAWMFPKQEPAAIVTPKIIVVDSESLKDCDKLDRIPLNATQEELDSLRFVWLEKYGICANRQHNSVRIIKKLANIEEIK